MVAAPVPTKKQDAVEAQPWGEWFKRAKALKLSAWQLYSGWRVPPEAKVLRTVKLAELACAEEMKGHYVRSDFFWRTTHASLPTEWAASPEWQKAVQNVLWAMHWALIRGTLRDETEAGPGNRAWTHSEGIEKLAAEWSELARVWAGDLATLRRRRAAAIIAEKPDEAIHLYEVVHAADTQTIEVTEALAAAYTRATFAALRASTSDSSKEQRLRAGLSQLKLLRDGSVPNLQVLDNEAALQQALAIHLANTERLSAALVELQRALLLDPGVSNGVANWQELVPAMEQMQQRMKDVQLQLAKDPSLQLNESGRSILKDAEAGFGPVNEFFESDEAAKLRAMRLEALQRGCWRAIGRDDFESAAPLPEELVSALSELFEHPPKEPLDVCNAWSETAGKYPGLVQLDRGAVERYLRQRLFPDDAGTTRVFAPQLELSAGPMMVPAPAQPKGDGEPLEAWLYSRRDLRVKVQCVVAALLVVITLGMGVREWRNRGIREEAFAAVQSARNRGDLAAIMDSCRRFLSHGLVANDSREPALAQIYDEALITWLIRDNPRLEEFQRRAGERPRKEAQQ